MKKSIRRLKGVLSISLIICVAVSLIGVSLVANAKKKGSSSTYAAGDDIAFGVLDNNIMNWTILSYDDTTKIALVVARKTLNTYSVQNYRAAVNQVYIKTGTTAGYVQWANSYWRGWLNDTFLNTCFTEAERATIQKTSITAASHQTSLMNFYHDTTIDDFYVVNQKKNSLNMNVYNNQTSTEDYIFFLSFDEYNTYKDTMKFETYGTWPLRTNSYDDPVFGLFVNDSTKRIEKWYYYLGSGIRPAMYVQLGTPEVTETADSTSSTTKSASTTDTATKTETTNTSTETSTSASTTDASATNTTATSTATTASTTTTQSTSSSGGSSRRYANNGTNIGNISLPADSEYTMSTGATAQVAIDLEYLNSTDKEYTITYTSSDASVFTVDSSGLITAAGKGTATLSVRMKKSNGKVYSMTCRIDVK